MTSRKGRCCVADCPTSNMEGVTYFSLPIDIDRRLNWLRAIGRPDMTKRDDLKSKNHVVCSIHFDERQISTLKQTLRDAVPTRYVPRDVKGVFKTLSSVRTQTDFSSDSDESDNEGNKRRHGEKKDDGNGKRLKVVEDLDEDSPAVIAPPNIDFENWNKFFEWKDRTTSRRRGAKFDKDFCLFALNLHSIDSRAYNLLMNNWQLPTEKELRAVELKIGPRFDDLMMSLLSQKFHSLSKRGRFCALGLYALKLKPNLYYDEASDDVIGIHNVNGNRTKKAASYALMAMVKGIKANWSQLLAFSFLSTLTDVDSIDSFIANVLVKLKQMKIIVLALVMPDDECFEIYCKTKKRMTVIKPFVYFDRDRLHVVFDVPHLLNRLRDDFITNDFIYKGKTVSWEYIKEVYYLIKENGGRLLPKLTDKHFEPDKSDKGLKYPCQIFSQSVASAIYFYAHHTVMAAQSENTAEFISKMNEVFDSLNSNKIGDSDDLTTEIKHAIRASVQYKALEDGLDLFDNLKPVRNLVKPTKELKTIEHFQVSLKSLMNVAEDLQRANQIGVTHTTFFYLEPMLKLVEEFKKNANSDTPTAIQFSRTFSRLFVENLVEIATPPASIDNMANFLKMADEIKDLQTPDPAGHIRLTDTDHTLQLPDESDESPLVYLSSYLLYKCVKFHGCKDLTDHYKNLKDLNKTNFNFKGLNKEAEFVHYLKFTSDAFIGYVRRLDDCFYEKFDDFYKNNPAVAMHEPLKYVRQCVWPCSCFPKEYLLKLFIKARIFETVEFNVRCWEEKSITQLLFQDERSYELKAKRL